MSQRATNAIIMVPFIRSTWRELPSQVVALWPVAGGLGHTMLYIRHGFVWAPDFYLFKRMSSSFIFIYDILRYMHFKIHRSNSVFSPNLKEILLEVKVT